jgi:hypothetical protein
MAADETPAERSAVVAMGTLDLRSSAAIRPSMPLLFRMAQLERRVATADRAVAIDIRNQPGTPLRRIR